MRGTETLLADLPDSFPVFPLPGAMLLPGGRLPLNIFEPRYLAMAEDSMKGGRMFAMIQPDPTRAPGATGPAIYRVGCLGRLTSFSETDDGRYLITLTGLIRFDVVSELEMVRGYRRVRGDFSRFAADLDISRQAMRLERQKLLEALAAYFRHRGFAPNWEAINAMEDVPLITSLSMACPFDPVEQQALLEVPGLEERAKTLRALLCMHLHAAPDDDAPPGRHLAS